MGFFLIKHPLILDKLTRIRKEKSNSKIFRENLNEIVQLMTYKIFDDVDLKKVKIKTPIILTDGYKLNKEIILFPILRAGLGMVDGILKLLPNVKIFHIGMYRDDITMKPKEYFFKESSFFNNKNNNNNNFYGVILDPMIATGGSACLAIKKIKKLGIKKIKFVSILAAPEGKNLILKKYPDIDIFSVSLDLKLNQKGYIIPGLGDAGDRIFGTK